MRRTQRRKNLRTHRVSYAGGIVTEVLGGARHRPQYFIRLLRRKRTKLRIQQPRRYRAGTRNSGDSRATLYVCAVNRASYAGSGTTETSGSSNSYRNTSFSCRTVIVLQLTKTNEAISSASENRRLRSSYRTPSVNRITSQYSFISHRGSYLHSASSQSPLWNTTLKTRCQ